VLQGVFRVLCVLALLCSMHSCKALDEAIESDPPPSARLSVQVDSTTVSLPLGGQRVVNISVQRIGDFAGPVTLDVEREPVGVAITLSDQTTVGSLTSATLTLKADPTMSLGTFTLLVRATGTRVNEGVALLDLNVVVPPAYQLALSAPSLTIARGGIARLQASVDRVNFPFPLSLTIVGNSGITSDVPANPLTGNAAAITVSVAPTVAAGTYALDIRGRATGHADRFAPISIVVIDDPVQLIGPLHVTAPQASSVSSEIIVNSAGATGSVTLSAENLPTGVTATFQPGMIGSLAVVQWTVGALANPGTTTVRLRGKAQGVPDAVADVQLTVTPAGIALSIPTPAVSVFQGASTRTTVKLSRTSFIGPVMISVDGLPSGLTVAPNATAVTGDTTFLDIVASTTLPAGVYNISVRATPTGLAPSAAQVAMLEVTVRAAATGGGNVFLDWSRCAPPAWLAAQDGSGPWTPLQPTAGTYRFSVQSALGGFAFVDGTEVTVRFMTQAELSASPIDMCPPPSGVKTVTGVSAHTSSLESWRYLFAGGSATSTSTSPNFTIANVLDGAHDLIGWSQLGAHRGLIRRDLSIPHGGSLGEPLSLVGTESFPAQQRVFTFSGTVATGESLSHTMSYLTSSRCTVNPLYSSTGSLLIWGVPEAHQRETDFHQLSVFAIGPTVVRTHTVTFHAHSRERTIVFPSSLVAPTISSLAAPYKRLRAFISALPGVYNQSMELRYSQGTRTMTVSATMGYTQNTLSVTMPDLSAASGWPNAAAIQSDATGTAVVTLQGSSDAGQQLCTDGRTTSRLMRTTTF
jgi:hypothetical protein